MTEWFEDWFGEEYLELYPHRDGAEAAALVARIREQLPWEPGWRVLDIACGAGRHAKALREAGARCTGLDLSATLLRRARDIAGVPLVRADMRRLPIRAASMDLAVNLFTSFGYFDTDEEHRSAVSQMVDTLRPAGWLVLDFLNAARVRAELVPRERSTLGGRPVEIARSLSEDGRTVAKTITTAEGRTYRERVRLFSADELRDMFRGAGLRIEHELGDYDGGALNGASPRVVLMGRRP